jgi:hypothetical protein
MYVTPNYNSSTVATFYAILQEESGHLGPLDEAGAGAVTFEGVFARPSAVVASALATCSSYGAVYPYPEDVNFVIDVRVVRSCPSRR